MVFPSVKILSEDIMTNVLDMTDRLQIRRKKEQLETYRDKLEALQRLVQCSSCHLKCAMCGAKVGDAAEDRPAGRPPAHFVFCEGCREEYEDFLSTARGKNNPDAFWQSKSWLKLWSTWLAHQEAIREFGNSREFLMLSEALDDLSRGGGG